MISPYAAPDEWRRTSVQIFAVLIVLAFVIPRLALLVAASGIPLSDTKWYFDRAVSIALGKGYAFDGTPTAFWPVGYPGFLALLFLVSPETPETGLIANFFLSAVTVACSFLIFCELKISNAWGLFGTLVLAVFPNFIFYQNLLSSEILMMTLISISLLFILIAKLKYHFPLIGICFGLATLVKSQILFLPVFIVIYDFWLSHQRKNVIFNYLMLAGGILVVVIPWTARNYLVFDRFILVQSNGGYNLLMGNNKDNRWGGSTGAASEFVSMFPGIVADINHALSDEMGMNDRAATVALHFIMSNPVEVLKRVPYKLYRFFGHDPQGIGSLLRSNAAAGKTLPWLSSLFQISYWYYTVIFALAMLSPIMFLIGPLQTRAHFVLLSTIFYFALISAVFFGEGRFHIPLLPEFVGCMLVTLHPAKARLWPPATSTE